MHFKNVLMRECVSIFSKRYQGIATDRLFTKKSRMILWNVYFVIYK